MGSLSLLQGNLHDPEIEPGSCALQLGSLPNELTGKPILCLRVAGQLDRSQFNLVWMQVDKAQFPLGPPCGYLSQTTSHLPQGADVTFAL